VLLTHTYIVLEVRQNIFGGCQQHVFVAAGYTYLIWLFWLIWLVWHLLASSRKAMAEITTRNYISVLYFYYLLLSSSGG
jgi:type VI protein secretion system component VasK